MHASCRNAQRNVFISYGHGDAEWVRMLAENLHQSGLELFFDEWDIAPGDVLVHKLDAGILASRSGILVVSPSALTRPYVQAEYVALMTRAIERGQRLILVLLKDAEMPPLLASRIWIDFRNADGLDYLQRVRELVRALKGERAGPPTRTGELRLPPGPTGQRDTTCFISYAHNGKYYTRQLSRHLEVYGVRILIPDDETRVGTAWIDALRDLSTRCDVLILIGTGDAFTSELVLAEVEYFRIQGRPILPIVFRGIAADRIPWFLRDIQLLQEDESALSTGPSEVALAALVDALNWMRSEVRPIPLRSRRARSRTGKHPLNEGKLILVGRGEVGKTSLVNRLVENEFNDQESKTQGIRITKLFLSRGESVFCLMFGTLVARR